MDGTSGLQVRGRSSRSASCVEALLSSVHDPLVIRHQGAPSRCGAGHARCRCRLGPLPPKHPGLERDDKRCCASRPPCTRSQARLEEENVGAVRLPPARVRVLRGSGSSRSSRCAAMRQRAIRCCSVRGGVGSGEERRRVDLCSRSITMTEAQESLSAKPVPSGVGVGWGSQRCHSRSKNKECVAGWGSRGRQSRA
jgi:hypothetical protein